MVTNPSSFVNSSRERSLSSTSSYPSLRCKLRICCLPCPRWTLRLERPTGCGLYTHTFQMAHTIYGPYGTILFGRFFCCSPTLLLLHLLPRLTFFVVVFPLVAFFTHTLSVAWFFYDVPLWSAWKVSSRALPLCTRSLLLCLLFRSTIGATPEKEQQVICSEVQLFCEAEGKQAIPISVA